MFINLSVSYSSVSFGSQFLQFPVVIGVRVCKLSQNNHRYCSYEILVLGLGIYDWDSSLLICNICNFLLLVTFAALFFTFPFFCVKVSFSFVSFSRLDIGASGIVFFLSLLPYVFCCICSTTFGTSIFFSLNSLSRNFVSVIDVKRFYICNSVLKSGNLHLFFFVWPVSASGLAVFLCLFVLP